MTEQKEHFGSKASQILNFISKSHTHTPTVWEPIQRRLEDSLNNGEGEGNLNDPFAPAGEIFFHNGTRVPLEQIMRLYAIQTNRPFVYRLNSGTDGETVLLAAPGLIVFENASTTMVAPILNVNWPEPNGGVPLTLSAKSDMLAATLPHMRQQHFLNKLDQFIKEHGFQRWKLESTFRDSQTQPLTYSKIRQIIDQVES